MHEELLHHQGVVLEVREAHQEGDGAGSAGEAGGLGVEEERAADVELREAGVEGQRRERRTAGREGALHRDGAVLRRGVEAGVGAVEGPVLGVRGREGPRGVVLEERHVGPHGGAGEAAPAPLELRAQGLEDRLPGGRLRRGYGLRGYGLRGSGLRRGGGSGA